MWRLSIRSTERSLKQIDPSESMLADGHQEDARRPLTTRTDASLFEMEIDLLAFVRAFGASSILIGSLPGARAARRMGEQTWIICGFGIEDAAII